MASQLQPMDRRFLVIGLGRFGRSLVASFVRHGVEVMALDRDEDIVQAISSEVDAAVCADATDETSLSELDPRSFSCAIVAIGATSTEGSILATALLQKLGAPRIVARAASELHGRVLAAIGAHEVINPEAEMGAALGRRLSVPNVLEHLELGKETALAEVVVPSALAGRTTAALKLRGYGISLIAIRRGDQVSAAVSDKERVEGGDVLVIVGPTEGVESLAVDLGRQGPV